MSLVLAEKARKWLEEKEKFCLYCGFNTDGRKANLYLNCLKSKCQHLIKKMETLKPYYEAKTGEKKK